MFFAEDFVNSNPPFRRWKLSKHSEKYSKDTVGTCSHNLRESTRKTDIVAFLFTHLERKTSTLYSPGKDSSKLLAFFDDLHFSLLQDEEERNISGLFRQFLDQGTVWDEKGEKEMVKVADLTLLTTVAPMASPNVLRKRMARSVRFFNVLQLADQSTEVLEYVFSEQLRVAKVMEKFRDETMDIPLNYARFLLGLKEKLNKEWNLRPDLPFQKITLENVRNTVQMFQFLDETDPGFETGDLHAFFLHEVTREYADRLMSLGDSASRQEEELIFEKCLNNAATDHLFRKSYATSSTNDPMWVNIAEINYGIEDSNREKYEQLTLDNESIPKYEEIASRNSLQFAVSPYFIRRIQRMIRALCTRPRITHPTHLILLGDAKCGKSSVTRFVTQWLDWSYTKFLELESEEKLIEKLSKAVLVAGLEEKNVVAEIPIALMESDNFAYRVECLFAGADVLCLLSSQQRQEVVDTLQKRIRATEQERKPNVRAVITTQKLVQEFSGELGRDLS